MCLNSKRVQPMFDSHMSSEGLSLQLTLNTDPRIVSVTRRFVEQAMEKLVDDADTVFRVAMTAHELLENAAKYAHNREASLTLSLEGNGAGERRAILVMSNLTSPDHLEKLQQSFAEMSEREDPYEYYFELMRQNAADPINSGLGLARIRAEGEMDLSLDTDGREIRIRATTSVPERRAR